MLKFSHFQEHLDRKK